MSATHSQASSASVSRQLRVAGFRPLPSGTPRTREGIRVSGKKGRVIVAASFDSESTGARRAADLAAVLNELGYDVRHITPTLLSVTRGVA